MSITPLPEPSNRWHPSWNMPPTWDESQMKAYGAAEYKRAIEDAVKVCDDLNNYQGHSSKRPTPGQCGWAVRQLGKKS